tara:strand:- start:471 stop:662 length:192 start_codon:yes stop_codon:yes gene_type:complete
MDNKHEMPTVADPDKSAMIIQVDKGLEVDLYDHGVRKRVIKIHDKSIHYAKSIVENWQLGVLS